MIPVDLGNATAQEAFEIVQDLASVNWTKIKTDLAMPGVIGTLTTAEDVFSYVSAIYAPAEIGAVALEAIILIIKARQAGLWAPAQIEDPAMQHADGPSAPGMGEP